MAYDNNDRRRHPRFNVRKVIYIEVVDRHSRSEADSTIVRCNTVDISLGGLRIWVQEPLPDGCQVNIAVPADEWKENLELVGKVMWVREADDNAGFWVGLELEDTSRENMEAWFKVVQRMIN